MTSCFKTGNAAQYSRITFNTQFYNMLKGLLKSLQNAGFPDGFAVLYALRSPLGLLLYTFRNALLNVRTL